jgi:hypothetical protein
MTGTLHDVFTIMTISRWFLLRMRNILNKFCTKNQNTHFIFNNLFRKPCRVWGNIEKYGGVREATNDNRIWRMGVACWISKATRGSTCTRPRAQAPTRTHTHTHTHTEKYVTLTAFPREQWFRKSASFLLNTYIACLVGFYNRGGVCCLHYTNGLWICFKYSSIFPLLVGRTHLQLHVAVTRRTSGNFRKAMLFRKWGSIG